MIGGVTHLGGLPGLPGRVTLSAGVTICHVNVSRWGNPPSWGHVHGKKFKSETCMFKNFELFPAVSCIHVRELIFRLFREVSL